MKKLNLYEVEKHFSSLNLSIFTPKELIMTFGAKDRAAEAFLSYNVKKGAIIRLKSGLFALSKNMPGDFVIANRLYYPSYVSLDSALSYYNLIPESVYAVTSVTTKSTREFEISGRLFSYKRIKKEAYTGYVLETVHGSGVYVATPEKAVADFIYFVYLGKREYNDRLTLGKINFKRLEEYLLLFSRKGLVSFAKKKFKENAG